MRLSMHRSLYVSVAAIGVVLLLLAGIVPARSALAASTAPLLPGETLWSGIPSYLFGSQDSYDYAGTNGLDQQPTLQADVAAAHVPLIRTWFEQVQETDHTTPVTDAHQLMLASVVHTMGATCLGNLTQPMTVAYALHLVTLLKGQCEMYEVMNEPDLTGAWPPFVSTTDYLAFWNSFVPQARAIDPNALFGGPATAVEFGLDGSYTQTVMQGMAASGVWPDFISYHWYTCSTETFAQCLSETEPWFAAEGKTLVSWTHTYFPGKQVPVGITEWNANPAGGGYMDNDADMSQYMSAALTGLENNPYLSFATQYDLGSYACFGSCDLFSVFPTSGPEVPRPEFTTYANEIARVMSGAPPSPTATPAPTEPPTPNPTATPPPSASIPRYDHVINIMEENHSYSDIIGSADAPYINGVLATQGALATNFTNEVASSLPNYMALTGGTDMGWTANCEPLPTPVNGVGPCPGGLSTAASIFTEVNAKGETARSYQEGMVGNCQDAVDTPTFYTVHHDAYSYYTQDLPTCSTGDVAYTQLSTDLQSSATLPAYVFITPNLNDDMHNGTVAQGDTWLSQQVPAIQNSMACQTSRCLIAVTFDEGSTDEHIVTILLGPDVLAGARDGSAYNHYNLLTTEELTLDIPPMTANDAGATPMYPMFVQSAPAPTPTPLPSPTVTPIPTPTEPPTPTPSPTITPTPSPTPVPCTQAISAVSATVAPSTVIPGGTVTVTLHFSAVCAGTVEFDGYWIQQTNGGMAHHSAKPISAFVGANSTTFTWTTSTTQPVTNYRLIGVLSSSDRSSVYATMYPLVLVSVT